MSMVKKKKKKRSQVLSVFNVESQLFVEQGGWCLIVQATSTHPEKSECYKQCCRHCKSIHIMCSKEREREREREIAMYFKPKLQVKKHWTRFEDMEEAMVANQKEKKKKKKKKKKDEAWKTPRGDIMIQELHRGHGVQYPKLGFISIGQTPR